MRVVLCCVLGLLSVAALGADTATVKEIVKDPAKYDGKAVVLTGKPFRIERKISRVGNPYFTFRIGTEKEFVNVYGKDKLEESIKEGVEVKVTGVYKKERRLGSSIYRNEIDCTKSLHKGNGVEKAGS